MNFLKILGLAAVTGGLVGCTKNFAAASFASSRSSNDAAATPAPSVTAPTISPTPGALDAELAAPTFLNFAGGTWRFVYPQSYAVGGVTLKITAGGDLQVVDAANAVLWHSDTKASCGACALNFQGDGNLVLSDADGKALWAAGTYAGGALATLSSVPPYFSVRDQDFKIMWPTSGPAGPVALLAATRAGPTAVGVKAFLDSLAVNSHVAQNGFSSAVMLKMLDFLGVKTIRDGWRADLGPTYATMAQNGVRFDVGASDPFAGDAFAGAEAIAALAPGALVAVEGPNEINNWSFVTDGKESNHGWPNDAGPLAQKFMGKLFGATHQNSKLNGTKVYDLTWGGTIDAEKYGFFDLTNRADFGNLHFYPPGQPYSRLQTAVAASYRHALGPQIVVTETGYDTANVSETAQAILTINLYLAAFQQGVAKTYVYELYDEWQTYGLFKKDFSPKPAATAIHNLTTILADSGVVATPGRLDYSITGLPATGHAVLLQKSNGKFDLIVWNETPVSGRDVGVGPVAITVSFGRTVAAASVYDVIAGTNATQTAGRGSSLGLNLAANALVVEITP